MPHTLERTVFFFKELSDAAKEKAREWYRAGAFDYEWWDAVYDDAVECAKILGIEIDRKRGVNQKGEPTTGQPTIYFSGFWSQGDGACFEGHYTYAKGCQRLIREHAPQDKTLHAIADTLHAIQSPRFFRLYANMKHRGHYSHEYCMEVDVYINDSHGYVHSAEAADSDAITEAMRDFARWIYEQLEKEYDWLNSDEQVDEAIEANEYEFDKDGHIA